MVRRLRDQKRGERASGIVSKRVAPAWSPSCIWFGTSRSLRADRRGDLNRPFGGHSRDFLLSRCASSPSLLVYHHDTPTFHFLAWSSTFLFACCSAEILIRLTRGRLENPVFKGGIFPSITVGSGGKRVQTG